jgi:hypothetical protein
MKTKRSCPASRDAVARRYPRVVGHLICHSLGYATPATAASIVFDAIRGRQNWCEWIACCYHGDPAPAVRRAISGRHGHRGYMAHYPAAKALVDHYNKTREEPMFASWF